MVAKWEIGKILFSDSEISHENHAIRHTHLQPAGEGFRRRNVLNVSTWQDPDQ